MGKGLAGCLIVALLFSTTPAGAAGEGQTAPPPDLVVRIGHLEQKLALLDRLWGPPSPGPSAKAGDPNGPKSLSASLSEMLKGTDWIDPRRAIAAAAVSTTEPQQGAVLLIPFQRPNDAFRDAYAATVDEDAYLVRLPPGEAAPLPEPLRLALRGASRNMPQDFVSIDMAARILIERHRPAIEAKLDQLESPPPDRADDPALPSTEQTRKMIRGLLDLGRQVERLTIGIDLDAQQLTSRFQVMALENSPLAGMLVEGGPTTLLDPYVPALPTTFRSHNFNLAGLMGLLSECCGSLYQQLGIDFAVLTEITGQLTGEMAGGVSYASQSMRMELITVLKPGTASDFLEKRYLPWMVQYGESMARVLEKPLGRKPEPLFTRSAESTIAGQRVYGLKAAVPVVPSGPPAPPKAATKTIRYDMRLAMMDNLLLTAPDDRRMAELIRLAPTLKPTPSRGSLMRFEVDLSRWIESTMQLATLPAGKKMAVPRMDKLLTTVDFKGGEANALTTIKLADIKAMVTFMGQIAPQAETPSPPAKDNAGRKPPTPVKSPKAAAERAAMPLAAATTASPAALNDAYALGALASAYGNDKAAIRHFERLLKKDPTHAHAQFQLGVSLTQTGDHQAGMEAINRALALKPDTPLFLYGRGRTLLLSGQTVLSALDFKKAADLGDPQAQAYLAKFH